MRIIDNVRAMTDKWTKEEVNSLKKMLAVALVIVMTMCGAALAEVAPSGWNYVFDDGWLYYAVPPGYSEDAEHTLVRYRPEDGAYEELAKGGSPFDQLCVMGGWVYSPMTDMVGVMRVRIDGSVNEVFTELANTTQVFGTDGLLFALYLNPEERRPYARRFDANTGEQLNDVALLTNDGYYGISDSPAFVDGWIYYTTSDPGLHTEYRNEGSRFLRARQDGTELDEWFTLDSQWNLTLSTIWKDRMYYGLVDNKHGQAQLRSVQLNGSGDTLVSEAPMYTWFTYEGFVYGSMLEWEPEYESFTRADSPTVRIQLSTGEMKTVGDFEPAAFEPAGPYLIYANSDDESWTHPLLMKLDGSNPIRLPVD